MALVNRISRLFKADFHAVLDRIEEPEQLLKQAIRDMEDELVHAEQRIRMLTTDLDGMGTRKSELEEKLAEIEDELDLCFGSRKLDLARSLVRKKLEGQRFLKRLKAKHVETESTLKQSRDQFDADRAALDGLQQKAEIIAQRSPGSRDSGGEDIGRTTGDLTLSEDEIEVAFLREQQARSAP